MKRIVLLVLATALASAGAASAKTRPVGITIRHQTQGCHAWAVNGGAFKASQHVTVTRGATLAFTDDDVMPHQLIQLGGPHVALVGANMHTMAATAHVVLAKPGTYHFGTKAGEDYTKGVKTVGEDNVLRLTVVVK